MPSDSERREVAARLRNFEQLRGVFRESNICAFCDVLGVGYMDWEHICARLADLIEPEPERTCHAITTAKPFSKTYELHVKSCSSCGYIFESESRRRMPPYYGEMSAIRATTLPNYCQCCGAKVER